MTLLECIISIYFNYLAKTNSILNAIRAEFFYFLFCTAGRELFCEMKKNEKFHYFFFLCFMKVGGTRKEGGGFTCDTKITFLFFEENFFQEFVPNVDIATLRSTKIPSFHNMHHLMTLKHVDSLFTFGF